MFEDSDLLQRNTLVLRATVPPDSQFTILDQAGREIGRITKERHVSQKWLFSTESEEMVLCDRHGTRVLSVVGYDDDDASIKVFDGQGQPAEDGRRAYTMKLEQGRRLREVGVFMTIRDATKTDVGSFAQAMPPEGDDRPGLTYLFTITAEVSPALRLGALGFAICLVEKQLRMPRWALKRLPGSGVAWQGNAADVPMR